MLESGNNEVPFVDVSPDEELNRELNKINSFGNTGEPGDYHQASLTP